MAAVREPIGRDPIAVTIAKVEEIRQTGQSEDARELTVGKTYREGGIDKIKAPNVEADVFGHPRADASL
jgi:hypothetical protein